MVPRRTGSATRTRRRAPTDAVEFRRGRDGRRGLRAHRRDGARSARRPVPRPARRARRRAWPTRIPPRDANSYPFAFDHVAQLFDHPAAPDLCVLHSAAHNWEDQGGHRGEHGSLGIVQARAPFVDRGQGRAQRRPRAAGRPAGRRRAHHRRAPRLRARRARPPPRRAGRRRAHRRARSRRRAARATSSASCSTASNPNVLYAMAAVGRGAERRPPDRDGHRVRVGRDGRAPDRHAGQPHVDPHRPSPRPPRDPAQRVVRPRAAASR